LIGLKQQIKDQWDGLTPLIEQQESETGPLLKMINVVEDTQSAKTFLPIHQAVRLLSSLAMQGPPSKLPSESPAEARKSLIDMLVQVLETLQLVNKENELMAKGFAGMVLVSVLALELHNSPEALAESVCWFYNCLILPRFGSIIRVDNSGRDPAFISPNLSQIQRMERILKDHKWEKQEAKPSKHFPEVLAELRQEIQKDVTYKSSNTLEKRLENIAKHENFKHTFNHISKELALCYSKFNKVDDVLIDEQIRQKIFQDVAEACIIQHLTFTNVSEILAQKKEGDGKPDTTFNIQALEKRKTWYEQSPTKKRGWFHSMFPSKDSRSTKPKHGKLSSEGSTPAM